MTASSEVQATRLNGPALALARFAWAAIFAVSVGLLILGTWDKFRAPLPADCAVTICNPIEFTAADAALLHEVNLPGSLFGLWIPLFNLFFNLGFIAVALFLAWNKSDDWLALMLSATLIILGGVAFSPANDVLYRSRPQFSTLVSLLQQPAYASLPLLLFLFPDGRFVPRRMWILAIPLSVIPGLIYLRNTNSIQTSSTGPIVLYTIMILLAMYSQAYRYTRVSTPIQRQQTKWGLFGIVSAFAIVVGWSLLAVAFPPEEPTVARAFVLLAVWPLITVIGLVMPVSFTVAVMRYKLWEIDPIIRRTLQYTALTGILAVTYFAGILLLQGFIRSLTGQAYSPLATVITTLGVAYLFNPLRVRVREMIDRRFYRSQYDAAQALAQFAQTAQDKVGMQHLTGELLQIVDRTMQPESLSIALRKFRRPEDGQGKTASRLRTIDQFEQISDGDWAGEEMNPT